MAVPAILTVMDSAGRVLRTEDLSALAQAAERLREAHRNYQAQGWNCAPLGGGRLNFMAEKAGKRIVIAIRPRAACAAPGVSR